MAVGAQKSEEGFSRHVVQQNNRMGNTSMKKSLLMKISIEPRMFGLAVVVVNRGYGVQVLVGPFMLHVEWAAWMSR